VQLKISAEPFRKLDGNANVVASLICTGSKFYYLRNISSCFANDANEATRRHDLHSRAQMAYPILYFWSKSLLPDGATDDSVTEHEGTELYCYTKKPFYSLICVRWGT
jgi:hypothetical protein